MGVPPYRTGSPSPSSDDDMTSEITVESSPREVDAGADMTLKGKVVCSPSEDLRGHTLLIIDQDGALAASVELGESDGETNQTGEFVVRAPVQPGAYTWLAVCSAFGGAGFSVEEASAPFSLTVKPHSTSVVVWDVPSIIGRGETFSVKLGVKCSSECRPDEWTVEVHDSDGQGRASATISGECWPGTAGLYYAEIDLSAPDMEGLYEWEAEAPVDHMDILHAECITPFRVRVVPAPECVLTVVAMDMESRNPVEGAKVVVHPYEAFTDEHGMAELRLPKGEYRLFVSGRKHSPFRSDGEMKKDVTITAELTLDRELSDADIWS